ncbi:epsilon-sarcoglycan-like isoform X2 [Acanthaster planci]|uniref:Epsilon-sarcoglycan-like isoform X2 n=1 Tax=Acanthaster planci TaxID=133434 RepID=A0A8B7XGR5_ACAPL|nr:epsilon-sarcoglycan-like isoform X2 [Acanthaster planci]
MACAFIYAVVFAFVSAISLSRGEEATVGINFQYVFEKENFFGPFSLGPNQPGPLIYKPSLIGKPGLPEWLRYIQTDPTRQAYMYGTPDTDNIGDITLEIIALNTDTYQSARVKVPISVTYHSDTPKYLATFFLSNQNVGDMLSAIRQRDFLNRSGLVWSTQTPLVIHRLRPPSDSIELGNPTPGKEGVYVTIGSTTPFSPELLGVNAEATSNCVNGAYVPLKLGSVFPPTFAVDWCRLELTQANRSSQLNTPSGAKPVTLGGEYHPPALTNEPPNHLVEFLLIVIPPLAVALIFVIVLGVLMCSFRGSSKHIARTPEIQLTHHQNLRQASRQLRALSNRRDGAPSSSPSTPIIPHGANPAVSSVQSSPRHHIRDPDALPMTSTPMFSRTSPPPYRVPPQHPSLPTTPGHQETSFSDPFDNRRLSEPGNPRGRPLPSPIRSPPPFMSGPSSRGYQAGAAAS